MADNATVAPPSPSNRGQRHERGDQSPRGQRRGRGTRGTSQQRGSSQRGRGRGRGDTNGHTGAPPHVELASQVIAVTLADPTKIPDEEAEDGDICFICASPVKFSSVSQCNHRTCHICGLRMRALYKTKACAHCRVSGPREDCANLQTESEHVVFTADAKKNFAAFKDTDIVKTDNVLGIRYDSADIVEETSFLLHYNCPAADCVVACRGWPDLHRHVRSVHGMVLCDLCTRNKKVFTHEHDLFTFKELHKHEKFGDDTPGAVDQSGFKGHPECGFCKKRFYGDDELYEHCRDQHERCFLCDRRSEGGRPQYYLNYDSLAEHFGTAHFPCLDEQCLEQKFVVFESEVDIKAHQLEVHGGSLSKMERSAARRVDLSQFEVMRGNERRRGNHDRNDELSHNAPLRRDELAYQRTMAVQSAQSVQPRRFGGQLTQNPAPPPALTGPTDYPSIGPLSLDGPMAPPVAPDPATMTPQERARRARHTSVNERVSSLLGGDPQKISLFRNKVSAYKFSKIDAADLLGSFWSLFDTNSVTLGKLIRELADLYEDESRRTELLKAWNDYRAINEDYPSLPGSSTGTSDLPNYLERVGGSKALRLKSATKQSERSQVNRQTSWGGASNASSSSSNATTRVPQPRQAASTTWSRPTFIVPAQSRGPSAITTTSAPSSPAPRARPQTMPTHDMFPSLPPAKKPELTFFGYGTGAVRRDFGSKPPGNTTPWNRGGPSTNDTSEQESITEGEADGAGKKKKGNKGKKQILFHVG